MLLVILALTRGDCEMFTCVCLVVIALSWVCVINGWVDRCAR